MYFEWIKDVICWAKQTWEGCLSLRWFWTTKLSTQTEIWMSCLPAEEEHQGRLNMGRPASLGRPAWVASCHPWLRFIPAHSSSLCDLCAHVLHELHRQNSLIHSFACVIGPSTWCLCFESCPCSFASHASIFFRKPRPCCPPMLVPCMWLWWKLLTEHHVMYHGACMICLTRLPASKLVLRLSTPLILKIKK
jgi:hypothetical protein